MNLVGILVLSLMSSLPPEGSQSSGPLGDLCPQLQAVSQGIMALNNSISKEEQEFRDFLIESSARFASGCLDQEKTSEDVEKQIKLLLKSLETIGANEDLALNKVPLKSH